MRHSDDQTMLTHYTMLGLSDAAGVINEMPGIGPSLDCDTGTCISPASAVHGRPHPCPTPAVNWATGGPRIGQVKKSGVTNPHTVPSVKRMERVRAFQDAGTGHRHRPLRTKRATFLAKSQGLAKLRVTGTIRFSAAMDALRPTLILTRPLPTAASGCAYAVATTMEIHL